MPGLAGVPVSTIGALDDHISPAVEDALSVTVQSLGRSVHAPRRDPLHGFDRVRSVGALQQRRHTTAACRPTI